MLPADPMTSKSKGIEPLLVRLADTEWHSGEQLARDLGLTRAAIWKQIERLRSLGLDIEAGAGRGYRLAQHLDLLNKIEIEQSLPGHVRAQLSTFEVCSSIDSTNAYLLREINTNKAPARVCLSEHQTAGRGRRARRWCSPFAANIYLSVAWKFAQTPPGLPTLALALTVQVVKTLRALGVDGAGIKWPNDLVWQQRKLGGMLVEWRGEVAGFQEAIAGVGINVAMPIAVEREIDQPWADLREICGDRAPGRNDLATQLIQALIEGFERFQWQGFEPFREDYLAFDTVRGKPARIVNADNVHEGIAQGIDDHGALLLRLGDGQVQRFYSGDVSLRLGNL